MQRVIKEVYPYVIIVLVVVLIRMFIVTPVSVKGSSMYPTLKNGEILLLNKVVNQYKRFDIVVVDYNGTKLVKRIIGLPGEYLEYQDNTLYINDKKVKETFHHAKTEDFKLEEVGVDEIPQDYYFVVGDNRNNSTDSRIIGVVPAKTILGKTSFVLFPFNRFGNVK